MKQTVMVRNVSSCSSMASHVIAVSLPAVPGIDITHERPETAPRCRVVTPQDRVTPQQVVEIVRRE